MIELYDEVKIKNPTIKGITKDMVGWVVDISYSEKYGYGYTLEMDDLDDEADTELICTPFHEDELILVKKNKA